MGKHIPKSRLDQQDAHLELRKAFAQASDLFQRGYLKEADQLCLRMLKKLPGLPDIIHFRGVIACQSGEPKRGVKLIAEAVAADPNNADYRVNLGNAYREIGLREEAIRHFRTALRLRQDMPELHNSLGVLYKENDEFSLAELEFREAIRLKPHFPHAQYNLAQLYLSQGDKGKALEQLQAAIRSDPVYTDAYLAMARIYKDMSIAEKAYPLYQELVTNNPGDWSVMMEYAVVLQQMGRIEESLGIARKAYDQAPGDNENACIAIGNALQLAGKHEEALIYFRKALEINPNALSVYGAIASSRKFTGSEVEIAEIKRSLECQNLDEKTRSALHFALGKVYNDCRLYDDAFRHYLEGNGLRRQLAPYASEETEVHFTRLINFFNKDFFTDRSYSGLNSDLPIFILGMPRSGTSLTEQIISSHPQVFGAGELGDFARIRAHLTHLAGENASFPESILQLSSDILTAVTNRFLKNLRDLAPDAKHITDKMPHNFLNLGLIAYLLPNAKIIHCKRNPLDNCLSIFFQNFEAEHPYKSDLHDLGLYYRQYHRLMAHWHEVLPSRIFDLQYEDLVENQEAVSRKLIEFCGLDWNDACLDFHKSERAVRTASQWQVRQPIYKTSTDQWRRYEKHIAPLIHTLCSLTESF
ncbi:MAG: hypothetical protein A2286_04790 [Gammaproteobacteria bacterium RIFOXYA12_FULL_61_12]|nr:MAG: hypothetical protein A2514_12630 [Gammaproteobacteria bacterium RIFOXYD12_FULL_61_37]OGT94013.1 MAG: hypothetical protein A2286_04790 [Gammaproteobacteria bacterium RIFOXYA12_FULL_61_12]